MKDAVSMNQRTTQGNTARPRHKITNLILQVFGCCLLGAVIVGCGQSQESARKELATLKKDFTTTDFVFSAMEGDKTAVSLFLKAGMDVNAQVENGTTALIASTVKKHSAIVKLLLDHGAKPDAKHNTRDQRGLTPLLTAISGQASEIVAMLLDYKADPNLAADDGMTPLMLAGAVGDMKVVTLLLNAGAKVNAADADGQTALMDAAAKQHLEVVSLLLKKGADIKAATKAGATALDAALGKVGITRLGLLGSKAFETQASKQQQETVQILRQAGAKPVSTFFAAILYESLNEVVVMKAVETKSAKDTRTLILNVFDNFKVIGLNGVQMTEARSQAVKSVTRARARIGMSGLSDQSAADKQVDQEFIELARELMGESAKGQP